MIVNIRDPLSPGLVEAFAEAFHFKGRTVGITSGCFDLFHYYHLLYLERCARLCDQLVVGVNTDTLIQEEKGQYRPITCEQHRIELIDALKCVGVTFLMNNLKDFALMAKCTRANFVFKNEAFDQDMVEPYVPNSTEFILVPDIEQLTSTTEYIDKILNLKDKEHEAKRLVQLSDHYPPDKEPA